MPRKPDTGRWRDGVAFRGGSWYFKVGWRDPASGAQRQIMRGGFRTRDEAVAARAEALTRKSRGGLLKPRMTLAEYLDVWLTASAARVRPSTLLSYTGHAQQHLLPRLGHLALVALDAATIRNLHSELLATGLSRSSVSHIHATLRACLNQAVRDGLLVANPASAAAPPRSRRPEPTVWTAEQAAAFLAAARGDRLYALWRLLLLGGLRRGEALGLRWADVDLATGVLQIRRSRSNIGGRAVEQAPKTNRSRRTVHLDQDTVEALREHAARQAEEARAVGEAWTDSGYVFVNELGAPLHPDTPTKLFRRLTAAAMLPPIRLHDLRHTCATLLLGQGVHPKVVADRLGHSTVMLTLDTYSHAVRGLDRDAAEGLGALLSGPIRGEVGSKWVANGDSET